MADGTVGETNEERKRELDAARRELESAMARCAAAELTHAADGSEAATLDGRLRTMALGAARLGDDFREGRVGAWRVSGLRRSCAAVAARAGWDGDGGRSRGDGDGALRVSGARS